MNSDDTRQTAHAREPGDESDAAKLDPETKQTAEREDYKMMDDRLDIITADRVARERTRVEAELQEMMDVLTLHQLKQVKSMIACRYHL